MPYVKFSAQDTAMLLIDHQVGTMGWAKSLPFEVLKRNALLLAKTAALLNIPVILTTSMEDSPTGPLLDELKEILPEAFEKRIKRPGIVDAMDDENFATAVKATGKTRLIIAGVSNDVCTVYPTLTLVADGYEVQVVADAGASPTVMGNDMALRRMEKHGATLTSSSQLVAELVGSWASPEGAELLELMVAYY